MSSYLMKYKGTYRLLPELDRETNDFPRDANDNIDESYDDIYIDCHYGNRIYSYGKLPDSNRIYLWAYIPSLKRGHNIRKQMDEQSIPYIDFQETDEEVFFKFKPIFIDKIAILLRAKTQGANISPFSTKNLPKTNVQIPKEKIDEYKAVISSVEKNDLFIIRNLTNEFCQRILAKTLRKSDKTYSFKADLRANKMSRSVKTYIYIKGFWDEYIKFLDKKISQFYKEKQIDS